MSVTSGICVIGAGRVGLITACCFAELGHRVVAIESDAKKIDRLRRSEPTFFEPRLSELLRKSIQGGRLSFSQRIEDGLSQGEVIFVCVGTPPLPDGSTDLTEIEKVARDVAGSLRQYRLIVEKSTVPPRTSQLLEATISQFACPGGEFDVACNPEFLREGSAIDDFLHPDRIVIGAGSERARQLLLGLYEGFDCPILVTDVPTAEIIKHASNAFLATKISFINMVANLCEKVGADVGQVADGMGLDKRIGRAFLNAGLGYGGGCLPKDVKAFVRVAQEFEVDFSLLKAVERLNDQRIDELIRKARSGLRGFDGRTIGLLGLAFKPETDDVRDAPSLRVIECLQLEGARLKLYDAQAEENMKSLGSQAEGRIEYCASPYAAAHGADALLILTEAAEWSQLEWLRIKASMKTPILIDGRNMLDPARMSEIGFEYYSMGRPRLGIGKG